MTHAEAMQAHIDLARGAGRDVPRITEELLLLVAGALDNPKAAPVGPPPPPEEPAEAPADAPAEPVEGGQ